MDELRKQTKALFEAYHFPGHDFKHVSRVSKLAKIIAESEGYDQEEAEIAGLLHDVGRTVKDSDQPHAHLGVPIARELLNNYTDLADDAKERILKAIELHSDPVTTGALNNIVQDADKLDGMGAIGINRAYLGRPNKLDFEEDAIIPPPGIYNNIQTTHHLITLVMEWYTNHNTNKPRLYTNKAREIGKPRYEFMKAFMEEIKREVEEF